MGYKVKAKFPAGVTMDDINRALARLGVGLDNPAPGMKTHEDFMEDGRIVFVEEWESKSAFDNFVNNVVVPAFEAENIPAGEVTEL